MLGKTTRTLLNYPPVKEFTFKSKLSVYHVLFINWNYFQVCQSISGGLGYDGEKNNINVTLCKFVIYLAKEIECHKSKMLYRVVGQNEVYFCCWFLFSRSPLGEKWERQETDTIASNTWYRYGSH